MTAKNPLPEGSDGASASLPKKARAGLQNAAVHLHIASRNLGVAGTETKDPKWAWVAAAMRQVDDLTTELEAALAADPAEREEIVPWLPEPPPVYFTRPRAPRRKDR